MLLTKHWHFRLDTVSITNFLAFLGESFYICPTCSQVKKVSYGMEAFSSQVSLTKKEQELLSTFVFSEEVEKVIEEIKKKLALLPSPENET